MGGSMLTVKTEHDVPWGEGHWIKREDGLDVKIKDEGVQVKVEDDWEDRKPDYGDRFCAIMDALLKNNEEDTSCMIQNAKSHDKHFAGVLVKSEGEDTQWTDECLVNIKKEFDPIFKSEYECSTEASKRIYFHDGLRDKYVEDSDNDDCDDPKPQYEMMKCTCGVAEKCAPDIVYSSDTDELEAEKFDRDSLRVYQDLDYPIDHDQRLNKLSRHLFVNKVALEYGISPDEALKVILQSPLPYS